MFTPQFGIYEQVKQSQLEMERAAQQDLEIEMAQPDAPAGGTRLGTLFARLSSHLVHSADSSASLAVQSKPAHKAV